MAKFACPRCGASARVVRGSRNEILRQYGDEFSILCVEAKERNEAGEKGVPLGECVTFEKALEEAANSGLL
jgi:hypothetical protein